MVYELTHSIKMYTIEVEERLKRHVFENEGKSVELDERFAGRVAQEFEVQAGGSELGGVAIAARKRASNVREEEKRVRKSPPIADAFAARNHTREWNKGEGKKENDEDGREGEAVELGLLLTRLIVARYIPSSRRLPTISTSACGGGGSIRVLHAGDANRT
jgi:hypothetical protein